MALKKRYQPVRADVLHLQIRVHLGIRQGRTCYLYEVSEKGERPRQPVATHCFGEVIETIESRMGHAATRLQEELDWLRDQIYKAPTRLRLDTLDARSRYTERNSVSEAIMLS